MTSLRAVYMGDIPTKGPEEVSLSYKQIAFIIYDNDVTLKNLFKRI